MLYMRIYIYVYIQIYICIYIYIYLRVQARSPPSQQWFCGPPSPLEVCLNTWVHYAFCEIPHMGPERCLQILKFLYACSPAALPLTMILWPPPLLVAVFRKMHGQAHGRKVLILDAQIWGIRRRQRQLFVLALLLYFWYCYNH